MGGTSLPKTGAQRAAAVAVPRSGALIADPLRTRRAELLGVLAQRGAR
jgi:hypothetical protein